MHDRRPTTDSSAAGEPLRARRRLALGAGVPVPRGFRGKLLLAFAGLVAVTVIGVGLAVVMTSSEQVLAQMRERVNVGGHVLQRVLTARRATQEAAAKLLADDPGLRAAVATHDKVTIETVLNHQRTRSGADLLVLIDRDGAMRTAGDSARARRFPLGPALRRARAPGHASAPGACATTGFDGRLYQLFVLPVKAPGAGAWVVVAFVIDAALVRELADLTGLAVTLLAPADEGTATVVTTRDDASALPGVVAGTAATLRDAGTAPIRFTERDRYLSAVRVLDSDVADGQVFAVLQMPTRVIRDTTTLLTRRIALLLTASLAVALCVGAWLAHRIANPVRHLIDSARRIERGDYRTPIEVSGSGEMALLGSAFATMQSGIREREAHIRHQADHDDLTGLANLRCLRRLHEQERQPYTLCLLSVTDLKDVNFSLGYGVGDRLLVALAQRLAAEPDARRVARVSGNEFAVVLPKLAPDAGYERARALQDRLSGSYAIDRHDVTCRCACAVIGFPRDAGDFQTLYRGAETTLEAARVSTDGCAAFLPGREEARARQLEIIGSFARALERGELTLHYQPKVELATRQVRACEALLRWNHPDLGAIAPGEFILLAERSGSIRRLTDWVLEHVIEQARAWQRNGFDMTVSVNLSAHDLADAGLARNIGRTLHAHDVNGERLVMEVTESAVMRDRDCAAAALLALKSLGARVSIDDFGTGQSSLAQLKRLPVDELKIDKSFVRDLGDNADDALIVRSTIDMGHGLGLSVVAEGVETEASLARLADAACDSVQGYYFSKPLPPVEFEAWVSDANRRSRDPESRLKIAPTG